MDGSRLKFYLDPPSAAVDESASRFMIRNRTRVVTRHPEGDW